jgi:signal transduction histidine kinase
VRTFNQMIARLESAFDTQRRFVADSSHELRTPLTVIRSNLHLLRRTDDPSERSELIDITDVEVARLNRMVNNLLYMAQMRAGHDLNPVLQEVELDSLLLDIFAKARSMAALKNQTVTLAHEDIAAALGDRDQLQHLLLNLLDNASKYTPEGGTIALGLWVDGQWARIEVRDNGRGIAATDLPLIFDRFYRASDARVRERTGSGLGLAIVKSIADAHNAHVEVFSKVGEGTTFRVWLPLARGDRPLPPLHDDPGDPDDLSDEETLEPTLDAVK